MNRCTNADIRAVPVDVVCTDIGYGVIGGAIVQIYQYRIVPMSVMKTMRRANFMSRVRVSQN